MLGVAEAIPTCRPHVIEIPLRHDVVIPEQHAIEGLGRGNEVVPVIGKDDTLNQGVNGRILNSDQV